MPGFVAGAGLAHAVLPIGGMGDAIVRRVAQGRTRAATPGGAPRGPAPAVPAA
jgi:hypothetical protein